MSTENIEIAKEIIESVVFSPYFGVVLALVAFLFVQQMVSAVIGGLMNKSVARSSGARPRILNQGNKKRILLVGDSTAFGAGATHANETLAGRFAHDFPDVEVWNYAVNGSITKDVLEQIKNASGQKFNLVLISTGGNDVWHFTNLRKVQKYLHEAIAAAQELSDGKTILLIYNYVGLAPAFPFFLRGAIMDRAEKIDSIFLSAARSFGIESAEVFSREDQSSFAKNAKKYFAIDGIHPSSEGYRVWYARLWSVLYLHNYGLHD